MSSYGPVQFKRPVLHSRNEAAQFCSSKDPAKIRRRPCLIHNHLHGEWLVKERVNSLCTWHSSAVNAYEQEDFVFDPLHYLSLLEQKTNALDQAAPLAGWLLPPVFGDLRRLLEARMGKAGKREYVQVLRLIESFSLDDVRAAISEALERGVISFDAVKHLVLCRIEKRPPRLNLLAHPYLPRAEVATTSARSYMGLLKGAAP